MVVGGRGVQVWWQWSFQSWCAHDDSWCAHDDSWCAPQIFDARIRMMMYGYVRACGAAIDMVGGWMDLQSLNVYAGT